MGNQIWQEQTEIAQQELEKKKLSRQAVENFFLSPRAAKKKFAVSGGLRRDSSTNSLTSMP